MNYQGENRPRSTRNKNLIDAIVRETRLQRQVGKTLGKQHRPTKDKNLFRRVSDNSKVGNTCTCVKRGVFHEQEKAKCHAFDKGRYAAFFPFAITPTICVLSTA
ncbi:hypothetical protein KCP75_17425 [Salmonella enterica subsp. enterica]|nr:hypothetical protein KCP75_17425 [Salmonella enterica subsp. enterica]